MAETLSSAPLPIDPAPARVLVVEDEPKLAALLSDYLSAQGHVPECVADGREALQAWTERRHDLVLLDLMLPGMDGLALCKELRLLANMPIVMLSSRAEEADRFAGLELGADDYIAKNPFSPREVMARVKAVLRRSRGAATGVQFMPPKVPWGNGVDALQMNESAWRAFWKGRALELTPNEFKLLRQLAAQPGRVYTRSQLLDLLQADGRAVTERAVDSHVKNLRRKLEQVGGDGEVIRSVYGVGYCCGG